MSVKNSKQIERHFKGVANHHRINILMLVAEEKGLTMNDIADKLDVHFKTISQHTRRLVNAGLLNKKYKSQTVEHSLSPYGKIFVKFIKDFQKK